MFMSLLNVQELTKIYHQGDVTINALHGVSFTVEKGEFIAVVGASGSGKSTLIHLIGGVDRADSGSILVNERDTLQLTRNQLATYRRQEVGIIYQFFNLIPFLTVEENIIFPLQLGKQSIDTLRLEDVLIRLDLIKRRHHYPNQLSGGEQQRTAIARTMMSQPSLLLADEPTGNLDSVNRKHVMECLKEMNKNEGQTILMVTHDMDLAHQADRILTFSDGTIIHDEVVM